MTARYTLEDLKYLMKRLRDPQTGCPWDVAQTYKTIASSTIEEAYEVVDAIEHENMEQLREELGDLLFQVVFYGEIANEEALFGLDDIVHGLTAKLIRRHPHVFPDGTLESQLTSVSSEQEQVDIKAQWEALKKSEREAKGQAGILADIPVGLPALTRAAKLQKRAASVGFDWDTIEPALAKIEEELQEVREALACKDESAIQQELGDLLFSVVNVTRHVKADPETCLRLTNQKFEQRFHYIEQQLEGSNRTFDQVTLTELDQLWDKAKRALSDNS